MSVAIEIKLFNWKNSWVLMAFLASVTIHITEAVYRLAVFDSYFSLNAQVATLPLRLFSSFAVFWLFRRDWRGEAPSFLAAWAVFTCSIITSRVIITAFHTHEPINFQVLFGLLLLAYGLYQTIQRENSFWKIAFGLALLLACPWFLDNLNGWSSLFLGFRFESWILYLLLAAVSIAVLEYTSRRVAFERFFAVRTLIVMIPLIILIGLGSFYGYRDAKPSFMFAWGVYTVFDVVLRIINNRLLREPLKVTHLIGMAMVVTGTMFTYLGGR